MDTQLPKALAPWLSERGHQAEHALDDGSDERRNVTRLAKLAEIAEALNLRGTKTNRGSEFTPTHIHRLLKAA